MFSCQYEIFLFFNFIKNEDVDEIMLLSDVFWGVKWRALSNWAAEVWMMGLGDVLFTYSIKEGGGQNGKMNI